MLLRPWHHLHGVLKLCGKQPAVKCHKRIATGKTAPPRILAERVVPLAINKSDRSSIADAVTYLCLPLKPDQAALSVLPASPRIVADVLDVDMDVDCDWDLSDIPPSGAIHARSNLQGDFSLMQ